MNSLYRILEYDGPIHSLRRWSQELLAYNFETIHRPAAMMKDIDALNRGPYSKTVATYMVYTAAIHELDKTVNSMAYDKLCLIPYSFDEYTI